MGADSQGIPLTISPVSWKSVFFKFKSLTLLLFWPIFLKTVNSTNPWLLQPGLPQVLTLPISSLKLVIIKSSIAFSLVGLSIICLKKLPLMSSHKVPFFASAFDFYPKAFYLLMAVPHKWLFIVNLHLNAEGNPLSSTSFSSLLNGSHWAITPLQSQD